MLKVTLIYIIVTTSIIALALSSKITPLQEKIHDKIAYIAAIVDRTHARLEDDLAEKYADKQLSISLKDALKVIHNHVKHIGKVIQSDLEELIRMSDNVPHSLTEVNQHFAEDHMRPVLAKALSPSAPSLPEWFEPTVKKTAKFAQKYIESKFNSIQNKYKG